MTFSNDEQAERWSELAATWLELGDQLERVSGEPGALAMERLCLRPAESVLDLGCGSGRTTCELARRVAPGGLAVGVDIVPEMIDHARRQKESAAPGMVEFVVADAQVHDLGQARFDAAYSRFGVMFFSDPVAAFGNIRRALRPGGRLAFVCWQSVFENEWMLLPGAAAMSVTGLTPPLPQANAPGPLSLAEPARIREVMGAAGYSDIEVTPYNDQITISEDRVGEVALLSTRVGMLRSLLESVDEVMRRKVVAAIEDMWRSRLDEGVARASRGVHVVSAAT
jgi:SAM-dependent methyltransferase